VDETDQLEATERGQLAQQRERVDADPGGAVDEGAQVDADARTGGTDGTGHGAGAERPPECTTGAARSRPDARVAASPR